MTVVAEVGDVARFANSRKLCSWAGLTPRVRNSDTTVRHGPVSKMGSAVLRWVLGEAAQVAKRHPPYAHPYAELARRRGGNIATTAIARRLLARAFHVLRGLEAAQASPAGAGPIVG